MAATLAFGSAAILTQMSGCCGGAPTHGCKFVEVPPDAAQDMSPDMSIQSCGPQESCIPGQTVCCFERQNDRPFRCIALNQICQGPSNVSCTGDQECPLGGAGQHCCGSLVTMAVQCQNVCSGDYGTDGTLRICKGDGECPPQRPHCGTLSTGGTTFFACVP